MTGVVLLATVGAASNAQAAPVIDVTAPAPGAMADETVNVVANVTSEYEVVGVVARVSTRMVSLARNSSVAGNWIGSLSLDGVGFGAQVLVVTATDRLSSTASVEVPIVRDAKPVPNISSPLAETVARPSIRLKASCRDPDQSPCTSLQVGVLPWHAATTGCPGQVLLERGPSIDEDLSLSAFADTLVQLCITAVDSAGQRNSTSVPIYVDSTPGLEEVEAANGQILDVSESRILSREAIYLLKLRTRGQSDEVSLPGTDGRLFGTGAIYWGNGLQEWKDGQSQQVASGTGVLSVRGDRAAWVIEGQPVGTRLFGGSNEAISADANFTGVQVVNDGQVLLTGAGVAGRGIWQYANGATSLVRSVNCRVRQAISAGGLIVYVCQSLLGRAMIYLVNPAGDQELGQSHVGPGELVLVSNDWVAYVHQTEINATDGSPKQVFVRAPGGASTQVSVWETESRLDALNSAGEVMLLNRDKRYRASPGNAPQVVSSALGKARWMSGQWYIVMGRSLFRVSSGTPITDAGADTQPSDAGVSDSGGDGERVDVTAPDAGDDAGDVDPSPPDAADVDASAPDAGSVDGSTDTTADTRRDATVDPDGDGCSCALGAAHRDDRHGHQVALVVLLLALLRLRPRKVPTKAQSS